LSKSLNAGVALILLFTVMAVIGSPSIGIHEECKSNAVDTDGDGKAGILDPQCAEYPFKDGNGQTETPENERRQSENGYNFGSSSQASNELEYFLLGAYDAGLTNQDICSQYFDIFVPPDQGIQYDSQTQQEASTYLIFWSQSLPQFPVQC
jgi:hypothetical protein